MSEPTTHPPAPGRTSDGARARVRRRAQAFLAALVPGATPAGSGGIWANAWPFPAVVVSAFLISWGAECAQFLVSQGMALAKTTTAGKGQAFAQMPPEPAGVA